MNEIVTNPFIANRVSTALLKLFTQAANARVTDVGPSDAIYYAVRSLRSCPMTPLLTPVSLTHTPNRLS